MLMLSLRAAFGQQLSIANLGSNSMYQERTSPLILRIGSNRIQAEFDATLEWMSSLGVKTSSGRLQEYKNVIASWASMPPPRDVFAAHELTPPMRNAILESSMFVDVYRSFRDVSANELSGIVDKLKKAVDGPADLADETANSSRARNFLFEAVVAAKLHCPNQGVHTFLSAPGDTALTYLSRRIFVECKRIRAASGIENNVRKACNQLAGALNEDNTSRGGGLVALELSSIISSDESAADEARLSRHMTSKMDKFIESSSADWQKVYPGKDNRILGTLLRFSRLIRSESDGLWVIATEWGVNPRLLLGWSEVRYMQRLNRALQSGSHDRNTKIR